MSGRGWLGVVSSPYINRDAFQEVCEALAEIDRLSLAISSAICLADPLNKGAVVSALKAGRAALARARNEKESG